MADLFTLAGSYANVPASGSPSGDPSITAPIDEKLVIMPPLASLLTLSVDTEVALPFGGITGASVVIVKAVGGKIKLRLTSADGSAQVVPVDSFAALISYSTPFTSVTVQRSPGVATVVKFFLGQNA